ncbi:hypothetical protein H9Q74_007029 [Fusarium xylarioides]|nr:hypothetical protein H9Q71_007510 [Fusarium xylarioides]KAG5822875.1 hypothetical protein H9Q74_007029 [Fusarium xylarioides]
MDLGDDASLLRARGARAWNRLDQLRAHSGQASSYNSMERRGIRRQFRSKARDPEADYCVVRCPESGNRVIAEILGRHPHRKKYLALALPSASPRSPTVQRGHYIDGSQSEYSEIFNKYCSDGSNHTLSIAPGKESLRGCKPQDFEQNLVLQMPWGKSWRLASFGVPHGSADRDFELFSKSTLAAEWGLTNAMDVLYGQANKAGQKIKTNKESTKDTKNNEIKVTSWGI